MMIISSHSVQFVPFLACSAENWVRVRSRVEDWEWKSPGSQRVVRPAPVALPSHQNEAPDQSLTIRTLLRILNQFVSTFIMR